MYHYCGIESFLSIIENSSLWLSDVIKSNDGMEYNWIKEKIIDNIEFELGLIGEKELKAWKTWIGEGSFNNGLIIIYAACFTECEDSLSQWRGYAQDGQGLAIGFSKSIIRSLDPLKGNPYTAFRFGKVFYGEKSQNNFIKKITEMNFEKLQYKGVGHVALEIDDFRDKFPFYKNPSFKEEKEWRLIMTLGDSNKRIEGKNVIFSENAYRHSNGKLISYISMDFSRVKRDFIKEIWIGPKSKVTPMDIRNLLNKFEYYDREKGYSLDHPIKICTSKSSYC